MMKGFSFIISVCLGWSALAAEEMTPAPKFKSAMVYDAKVSGEIISGWVKGKRNPAQAHLQYSEGQLTESFKKIRAAILSAKTADDLEARLVSLEAEYETYSPDAKFFAAQMLLLKPMRGVVWRLRPLFEQKNGTFDFFSGNRGTHSAAVTVLRMLNHAASIYVPTKQADALFDYLTIPSKSMRLASQFKTVPSFQAYLRNEIYPALDVSSKRLAAVYRSGKTPFVFDNQILYGTGAFDDGIQRFAGHSDAEVAVAQAAVQKAMHNILVFCAYNHEQAMNVAGEMGKVYGVDGFRSDSLGVTSKDKVTVLNSYRSKGFLRLIKTNNNANYGKQYMEAAYNHLVAHVAFMKDAHDILAAQPANGANVLNPLFFKEDVRPHLRSGIESLSQAVNRRHPVRSGITGESIQLDIPAFYKNPPESMLDLLPVGWQKADSHEVTFKNEAGENITYRRYDENRPIAWNNEKWRTLFPSVSPKQTPADSFRVLALSYGPGVVLGPMTYFIY